jgi:hypothetical protein
VPQITTARLRTVATRWRTQINKYRGVIPTGLAVAHIVAESNGEATPVVRDAKRSIGLCRIPKLVGQKYSYTEEDLEDPIKNLYVWCLQTNADGKRLSQTYLSAWTQANYDYWLSLRLVFVLGFLNYNNLVEKLSTIVADQVTADLQYWIRNTMTGAQRFGTFRARDLRRIADELDQFHSAMKLLDGPNKVSARFYQAPEMNPGGEVEALRLATR